MNNGKIFQLIGVLFFIIVIIECENQPRKSKYKNTVEKPTKYEWQLVSQVGGNNVTKFIYVEPIAFADEDFIKAIIKYFHIDNNYCYLLFYDKKSLTPLSFPMNDEQMLHWKARYAYNPASNFEEFAYYIVVNRKTSPPEMKKIIKNL
jgi:hypothetical protein